MLKQGYIIIYFRYFNTKIGRYLRGDPIGLEGGLNLYNYAYSNSLNLIDPLGLDAAQDWMNKVKKRRELNNPDPSILKFFRPLDLSKLDHDKGKCRSEKSCSKVCVAKLTAFVSTYGLVIAGVHAIVTYQFPPKNVRLGYKVAWAGTDFMRSIESQFEDAEDTAKMFGNFYSNCMRNCIK